MPTGHAINRHGSTASGPADARPRADTLVDLDALGKQSPAHADAVRVLREILERARRDRLPHIHLEAADTFCRLRFRHDHGLDEVLVDKLDAVPQAIRLLHTRLAENAQQGDSSGYGCSVKLADGVHLIEVRCWQQPSGLNAQLTLRSKLLAPAALDEFGISAAGMRDVRNLLAASHAGWLAIGAADEPAGTALIHAIAQELASPDRKLAAVEPHWHPHLARVTTFGPNLCTTDVTGLDVDAMLLAATPSDDVLRALAARAAERLLIVHRVTARRPSDIARRLLSIGLTPQWLALVMPAVIMRYRLRRLCQSCLRTVAPESRPRVRSESLVSAPEVDDVSGWLARSLRPQFRRGDGCHHCDDTGYAGAIELVDLVSVTEHIRQALHAGDLGAAFMRLDTSQSLISRLSALVARGEIDEEEAQRHLTRRY